jgi:hypothetical protein
MKMFVCIFFLLVGCAPVWGQANSLADSPEEGCRLKLEKIIAEIDARRKKYEFNAQEYTQGFFCSECGRTKSEIEERAHINFNQHILDGAAKNRHALIATQKMYDDLYTEYLDDFKKIKKVYDNKYYDCGGDGATVPLRIITNDQLTLYLKKINGYVNVYKTELDVLRIEYNFYYSWTLTINIRWWEVHQSESISITQTRYNSHAGISSNAIERTENLFNNYLQQLADKQRAVFPGTGTQPSWPHREVSVLSSVK